jgi:chromosome segregation ATPase
MTRATKAAQRDGGAKADEPADSPIEALEKALQVARGETMRAQRDLESARLEMAEQKRRNSQQAMVASEALKEARAERDRLRVQLDALRGEMALEKKRGRPADTSAELEELRAKLAAAEERERALEASLAAAQAALAEASRELEAKSAPPPAVTPPAEEPRGFFGKLFGRPKQ